MEIAKKMKIRDSGFDEYWLQQEIAIDPTKLGLGDLILVKKEKKQGSSGSVARSIDDFGDDSARRDPEHVVETQPGHVDISYFIKSESERLIRVITWPIVCGYPEFVAGGIILYG